MLRSLWQRVKEDIDTVFERDPAARSVLEVLTCYPGLHAVWAHRIAHRLWHGDRPLSARMLSHLARWLTGVEIHPAASIGRRFFIDHGMGVVIGETSEVGDDCTIYHGVTLGGTSWRKEKRHPTLGDFVVIGAGAKVLGPVMIGAHSKIGAGSVMVNSAPPHSTIVGVPGRVVNRDLPDAPTPDIDLEHGALPDPVARSIQCLFEQLHRMEDELDDLRHERTVQDERAPESLRGANGRRGRRRPAVG